MYMYTWVGNSGNWSDPLNWQRWPSINGVPGPDDYAYIKGCSIPGQVINVDVDITCARLSNGAYSAGRLPITINFNGKTANIGFISLYDARLIGKAILTNSIINTSSWYTDNMEIEAAGSTINIIHNGGWSVGFGVEGSGQAYNNVNFDCGGVDGRDFYLALTEDLLINNFLVIPYSSISANLYIGNDFYYEIPDPVLTINNWLMSNYIAQNFHLTVDAMERWDEEPSYFVISKSSGIVSIENVNLYNSHAIGGATFNAYLTNGNIDGGGNIGWIWYRLGAINMRQALADPAAVDAGNKEIQQRVVSKTIQTAFFTNNRNAVWAGQQHLRKAAYPFATINFPANRKAFRYDIGDCFRFSCAKYGVTNMICRIMQIQEDSPESEVIKITAMEDIFSSNAVVTQYSSPNQHAISANDYSLDPLENQKIFEVPYYFVSNDSIKTIAISARENPNDLGFDIYMSIDNGDSYQLIARVPVLIPYGILLAAYPNTTFSIDDDGFIVNFAEKIEQDIDQIETITWGETFAGMSNLALLGNEIISFQSIEPVSDTQYRLSGIIRGRYGTQKQTHSAGEDFYILNESIPRFSHSEIRNGVTRQFKLVPYNLKFSGDVSEATAIELAIVGKAATPYIPINFCANGSSFAARY